MNKLNIPEKYTVHNSIVDLIVYTAYKQNKRAFVKSYKQTEIQGGVLGPTHNKTNKSCNNLHVTLFHI